MALTWEQHQKNIFGGESGGDYDALFGYQNRPNGAFAGIKVSEMPIGDVIRFTSPTGKYGQYVAKNRPDPEMGVATPVGAYQVVGSTLRKAVDALGLDPNQKFDKATQDKIGQYILKTQGTGAWEGYGKGGASMDNKPAQMAQPQQSRQEPQGLLGDLLGGQGVGGALGLSDDFRDRLKMGLLLGSDPRAFAPMVSGMQQAAKERRAMARTTAQANATADYLERMGQADLANLLRQGGVDAKTALSAGGKDTALIRQAIAAGLKPNTPEFRKYILSGGDIYGAGAPVEFGPLEKGTMLIQGRDEQGNITYQVQPISGSQAELDAKKAAEIVTKQTEAKVTSGTTVLGDITEMKRKIEANPTLTTGMIGSLLLRMGFTTAVDVNELGETIRSNIGFDRLQRMREESPTGGALGQVAVQELNALQASLGSLKTSQSDDQLIRNLERLEKQYQQSMRRILETEGSSEYFTQNEISEILGTKPSNNQGSQPDFSTMSDAELNAWIEENS